MKVSSRGRRSSTSAGGKTPARLHNCLVLSALNVATAIFAHIFAQTHVTRSQRNRPVTFDGDLSSSLSRSRSRVGVPMVVVLFRRSQLRSREARLRTGRDHQGGSDSATIAVVQNPLDSHRQLSQSSAPKTDPCAIDLIPTPTSQKLLFLTSG